MSAEADDLRYFYSEVLGRTITVTAAAAGSTQVVAKAGEGLEPGRYMLRVLDYGGGTSIWVRQGDKDVVAAAAVPSTQFMASTDVAALNARLFTFTVRGTNNDSPDADNFIAVFPVGGNARVQITKISRGKL
jgi:hypothetical protein